MNQPKRNLKIWIPIAAVVCFWLGDWMGHTYELTDGTTTHRLAAALNLNSLLLHPFRLSADAFSLGCGIATALMAGLIYLCVKYNAEFNNDCDCVMLSISACSTKGMDKVNA